MYFIKNVIYFFTQFVEMKRLLTERQPKIKLGKQTLLNIYLYEKKLKGL